MIRALVVGDAEVSAKLDRIAQEMPDALNDSIGRLVIRLQTKVKREKLSGQTLNVRTGRLRRSIEQVVQADGPLVSGIVSTNVAYAAFHEFGFSGEETVRAHLRRSREQFAFRTLTKSGRETAASARKGALTGAIQVREFARHVNYPQHSFLRTALREMVEAGEITAELRDGVKKVTK